MQEVEQWKEINGCSGYFISNFGNVRGVRFNKNYCTPNNSKGYPLVRIPKYNFTKPVHRLVALAFISNPENKPQINHKDGNKENNHYSNLEFVSGKENINHAIKTGLRTARANLAQDIFDTTQVRAIKYAINNGHGNKHIAAYFKCHHSTISKIRTGKHYANVSI